VGWVLTSRKADDGRITYGVAGTVDGGCHWKQLWVNRQRPDARFHSILFVSDHEGWIYGESGGSLMYSKDGGHSWISTPGPASAVYILDAYFDLSGKGWLFGSASKNGKGRWVVLHTGNRGASWSAPCKLSSAECRADLPKVWDFAQGLEFGLRSRRGCVGDSEGAR
jgi:hypothetical protein